MDAREQHRDPEKYPVLFQALALAATLLPISAYWHLVLSESANTPYLDDFYDILFTAIQYKKSSSITDAWAALTWQYHQHFLLLNRAVYLLINWQNSINFQHILIIGNGLLTLCFLQICITIKKSKIITIPILSAIFFNMQFNESTFWPMASIQTLAVMTLVIGFFHTLCSDTLSTKKIIIASAACWTATFTHSYAILVAPLGIAAIITRPQHLQKSQTRMHAYLHITSSMLCMLTFLILQRIEEVNELMTLIHGRNNSIINIATDFLASISSLPLNQNTQSMAALIVGIAHIAIMALLLKKAWKTNKTACFIIIFCALSLLGTCISRTPFYGSIALISRYKILNSTLLCGEAILLTHLLPARLIAIPAWTAAITLNLYSITSALPHLEYSKKERESSLLSWAYTGDISTFMPLSANILAEAYQLDLYNPVQSIAASTRLNVSTRPSACPTSEQKALIPSTTESTPSSIGIMLKSDPNMQNAVSLWFCSNGKGYNAYRIPPRQRNENLKNAFAILEKRQLPPASYQVLMETKDHRIIDTGLTINSETTPLKAARTECELFQTTLRTPSLQRLYESYCSSAGA